MKFFFSFLMYCVFVGIFVMGSIIVFDNVQAQESPKVVKTENAKNTTSVFAVEVESYSFTAAVVESVTKFLNVLIADMGTKIAQLLFPNRDAIITDEVNPLDTPFEELNNIEGERLVQFADQEESQTANVVTTGLYFSSDEDVATTTLETQATSTLSLSTSTSGTSTKPISSKATTTKATTTSY